MYRGRLGSLDLIERAVDRIYDEIRNNHLISDEDVVQIKAEMYCTSYACNYLRSRLFNSKGPKPNVVECSLGRNNEHELTFDLDRIINNLYTVRENNKSK